MRKRRNDLKKTIIEYLQKKQRADTVQISKDLNISRFLTLKYTTILLNENKIKRAIHPKHYIGGYLFYDISVRKPKGKMFNKNKMDVLRYLYNNEEVSHKDICHYLKLNIDCVEHITRYLFNLGLLKREEIKLGFLKMGYREWMFSLIKNTNVERRLKKENQ